MSLEVFQRRGERQPMWLNKLKIAIIEKNTEALDTLMSDIPQLSKKEELEQAIYLIKEASELVCTLRDETSKSMEQIKINLQFLRSTDIPTSKKLDIRS